jgi:hypothetical protein
MPHLTPSTTGSKVCPGATGGVEYGLASFDTSTKYVYQDYIDECEIYTAVSTGAVKGHQQGQSDFGGSTAQTGPITGGIDAIDPTTGKIVWHDNLGADTAGGALSTAGGVVFTGADNGHFYGIDAKTGKILWSPNLGLGFGAAPIAYQVNGTEYIAVAVGGSDVSGILSKTPVGGTMVVFKLGGSAIKPLPAVSAPVGTTKLPSLTGYTKVNPYVYENTAKKIVVIQAVAASTSANNGFNFDGYYNGQATFTVPEYWSVFIEYLNKAALPHSVAITSTNKAPASFETFGGNPVSSVDPTRGNVGKNWQLINFAADHTGKFYMVCLVPGHLQSGMWDNFVVSSTAKAPSLSTSSASASSAT